MAIEEKLEEEKRRLDEDLEMWEECYKRFKDRFEVFGEYERRIHELEEELEKRERIWGFISREKKSLFILAVILTFATIVLLNTISQLNNRWVFFIVGLLVGIGWGTFIQAIVRLPFLR
jgi:hypothetical protein